MQNLAVMTVLQCQANLCKEVQYFFFVKGSILTLSFLDEIIETAFLGVLHHDVPILVSVSISAHKLDNVRMIESLQNLRLIAHFPLSAFRHLCRGYSFDHVLLSCVF